MSVAALKAARQRGQARYASMRSTRHMSTKSVDVGPSAGTGMFAAYYNAGADRERYNLYKGTVYSAINAIAVEAAGQPMMVGRLNGATVSGTTMVGRKARAAARRAAKQARRRTRALLKKMPRRLAEKAAAEELEVLQSHPFMDAMNPPNPVQGLYQFVYSFVANICLTGWAYIIHDVDEDGKDIYYSLPTTWVTPIHDPTPFAKFKITNPNNPGAEANSEPIDREHVGIAYLPNPADPLAAYAPAQSQIRSIRIDDNIQTSQEMFFENGIFPSVIVSIGKDPHPDVPGDGTRPRLTGAQRRQVDLAIRKAMGGIAQFGSPAIVDGLIESIEKLSMDSTEMGWDKSEDKVRDRILTAFGVHPYILGHPQTGVSGHAQMYVIEQRFYKRVNSYLAMLGAVMTELANKRKKPGKKAKEKTNEKLEVWWEQCVAVDLQVRATQLTAARNNDDISQDELRAELGYGPDEDRNQQVLNKTILPGLGKILELVAAGSVSTDQAASILKAMGIPDDQAAEIAGVGREAELEEMRLHEEERQDMQMAAAEVDKAVKALQTDPSLLGDAIFNKAAGDNMADIPLDILVDVHGKTPVLLGAKRGWDDYRDETPEEARNRVREEAARRREEREAARAAEAAKQDEEEAPDKELTRAEQQAKIDEALARIDAIEAKTEHERAKTEEILAAIEAGDKGYNPNQPRVPAGQPGGGRWAAGPGGGRLFHEHELNLPAKARQPHSDKEGVYNQARNSQRSFEEGLDHGEGVDAAIGGKAFKPASQEEFLDALRTPGPVILMAPLKGEKRAAEKVNNKYGGDWSRLTDVVRATVAVEDKADIPGTVEAIRREMAEKGWEMASRPDNRIETPAAGGYRDLQTLWRSSDGHVAELQINTKAMILAKETRGHALYEDYRRIAEDKGAAATVSGQARLAELETEMQQLYEDAWHGIRN